MKVLLWLKNWNQLKLFKFFCFTAFSCIQMSSVLCLFSVLLRRRPVYQQSGPANSKFHFASLQFEFRHFMYTQSFIKQKASFHLIFSWCLFPYSTNTTAIKTLLNFNIYQIHKYDSNQMYYVPVLSLLMNEFYALLVTEQTLVYWRQSSVCQQLESYRGKKQRKLGCSDLYWP